MAPNILGTSTITKCSMLNPFYTSVASTANQFLFYNKSFPHQPSLASAWSSSAKPNLNVSTIVLKFPPGSIFKQCQNRIRCWTGSESGIEENDGITPALLERPAYVPKGEDSESVVFGPSDKDEDGPEEEQSVTSWVDWEDIILKDTLPLKGLARIIIHTDWYKNGERLIPEHETIILEKLLPYHPELDEKIGCGVDFITKRLEKMEDIQKFQPKFDYEDSSTDQKTSSLLKPFPSHHTEDLTMVSKDVEKDQAYVSPLTEYIQNNIGYAPGSSDILYKHLQDEDKAFTVVSLLTSQPTQKKRKKQRRSKWFDSSDGREQLDICIRQSPTLCKIGHGTSEKQPTDLPESRQMLGIHYIEHI